MAPTGAHQSSDSIIMHRRGRGDNNVDPVIEHGDSVSTALDKLHKGARIREARAKAKATLAAFEAQYSGRSGRYSKANTLIKRAAEAELVRLDKGLESGDADPSAIRLDPQSESEQQASIAMNAGHHAAATMVPTGRAPAGLVQSAAAAATAARARTAAAGASASGAGAGGSSTGASSSSSSSSSSASGAGGGNAPLSAEVLAHIEQKRLAAVERLRLHLQRQQQEEQQGGGSSGAGGRGSSARGSSRESRGARASGGGARAGSGRGGGGGGGQKKEQQESEKENSCGGKDT